MSRRAQSMPAMIPEKPKRRPVVAIICFSWKVFTCIFSHVALVSMVVAYCIAGALIFEHLEAENEKTVKLGIRGMRTNVTDDLWDMTTTFDYLHQDNWTRQVENRLELFEREILTAMKTKGWDGNENEQQMQWTFFGALFYSIIVITTIGYGHIAPKTDMGKVITIFYAILGIPLMLLCLSNIGDVMASSFRFLYWRVCCYVCTREPKKPRRARSSRMNTRQPPPPLRTRSQPPPSLRRSVRTSQKSADSGFITRSEYEQNLVHSFSDPQLRYNSARYSDRHRSHRTGPREDFQYDVYDERPRDRSERGRDYDRERYRDHDPGSPRQATSRYDDYDEMYNERGRSSNRSRDRRYDRDRSPDDNWDERDRERDRGRDYDRDHHAQRRRGSDYGMRLDPYDEPEAPPRGGGRSERGAQRFSNREQTRERLRDRHTVERERNIRGPERLDPLADFDDSPSPRRTQSVRSMRGQSAAREMHREQPKSPKAMGGRGKSNANPSPKSRAKSMDAKGNRRSVEPDEYGIVENRYATLEDNGKPRGGSFKSKQGPQKYNRSHSLPRNQTGRYSDRDRAGERVDRLEVPETPMTGRRKSLDRNYEDEYDDDYRVLDGRVGSNGDGYYAQAAPLPRREKQAMPPSPRIMSPMGFAVHRQAKYTRSFEDDNDYYMDDEWDSYTDVSARNRPVPIWLCVFLVVGYIIAGAFLFSEWEHWSFLDSAYFCFITLTTIGFGDFVPAQGVKENSEISIALCSLYLLFGISLLAMSFNLVQEEVIANVKSVARRLGILKEQEMDG